MQETSFYVIVYDISHPRRLVKVAKLMEQFGERVQDSVFEAWLTPVELNRLKRRLQARIDADEDRVRIYSLCQVCREKIEDLGQRVEVAMPGVRIV
jgi:CRISPR-associated protein Cas2